MAASSCTVSDLDEPELVARIQRKLPPKPDWLIVGIGDDAAVVEHERNRLEVLTVDAVVEGVHFDRRFTPPEAIGHRALAVNLSDLAAMGASPRLALLSLALPDTLPCNDFDAILDGMIRLASNHRVHVVGGNLTRSPGPLVLDITMAGSVRRRRVLTRGGARPGDEIYVTGTIGAASAGLQVLRARTDGRTTAGLSPMDLETLAQRYLYPQPRVRAGVLLGRNSAATACIDLSDGLADGVHRIAESARIGVVLQADALPLDANSKAWFESQGKDAVLEALLGGDDYELAFAVRPARRGRLAALRRHGNVAITRIGVCTPTPDVRLCRRVGNEVAEERLPRGFDHFR